MSTVSCVLIPSEFYEVQRLFCTSWPKEIFQGKWSSLVSVSDSKAPTPPQTPQSSDLFKRESLVLGIMGGAAQWLKACQKDKLGGNCLTSLCVGFICKQR